MDLWLSVLCIRLKAWLATRVPLRQARLPRTASSALRSRHLRPTRAATRGLLAHTDVTKIIIVFSMGPQFRSWWYWENLLFFWLLWHHRAHHLAGSASHFNAYVHTALRQSAVLLYVLRIPNVLSNSSLAYARAQRPGLPCACPSG